MRAKLFLAAVAGILLVWACSANTQVTAPVNYTQACTNGTCTGSFPAIWDAGMVMSLVTAYRLSICAWSGQTLSGAGTMRGVWGDSVHSLPIRNADLDATIDSSANGVQCETWNDILVPAQTPEPDYAFFYPNGVTVSGVDGGPITVYLTPTKLR